MMRTLSRCPTGRAELSLLDEPQGPLNGLEAGRKKRPPGDKLHGGPEGGKPFREKVSNGLTTLPESAAKICSLKATSTEKARPSRAFSIEYQTTARAVLSRGRHAAVYRGLMEECQA
jgi:hypothetical protein